MFYPRLIQSLHIFTCVQVEYTGTTVKKYCRLESWLLDSQGNSIYKDPAIVITLMSKNLPLDYYWLKLERDRESLILIKLDRNIK